MTAEGAWVVQHVQPYQAVKTYRCPGCDHEIPPRQGHEVVMPAGSPGARRHWHTGCWRREAERRRARAPARRAARRGGR